MCLVAGAGRYAHSSFHLSHQPAHPFCTSTAHSTHHTTVQSRRAFRSFDLHIDLHLDRAFRLLNLHI